MALMTGKRGLIMGMSNSHSIGYGVAKALHDQGAEIAFTCQNDAIGKRMRPLAEELGGGPVLNCDVAEEGAIAATFEELAKTWPTIDFVVHSLAFADRNELKGKYLDTSRENFLNALLISAFSLTEVAKAAQPMMPDGGAMVTLTFLGSQRVMPNYNVMGVAKAALEASLKYLASDLGPQGIRINAISAGTMRTISGAAIANSRFLYSESAHKAALKRNPELMEVGNAGLYFCSDLSSGVTGNTHYVDGGFHAMALGIPDEDQD